METNSMQSIKNFLEKSVPLYPVPTGVSADVRSSETRIKSVIFDIYGTLLVSASGDIDKTSLSCDSIVAALNFCGIETTDDENLLALAIPEYKRTIGQYQELGRSNDCRYPEIDIRAVWQTLLEKFFMVGIAIDNGKEPDIDRIAFIFEILSNRVYPMPDMEEIIVALYRMNLKLGVISNAQFYTPIIMNYFMSGNIVESERIDFFDEDLSLYSYKERRSKPDVAMFQKLAEILRDEHGIKPEETLFIGNDMYKDVYPAATAGFQTVLFAGDKRSLRMREDQPEVAGITPDYTITELEQLKEIVGA